MADHSEVDVSNGLVVRAASLVNLLPTGTYFAFMFLVPIVTDDGNCDDPLKKYFTIGLLGSFALFCFFSCFTDTVKDSRGRIYIGFAKCSRPGLCFPLQDNSGAAALLGRRFIPWSNTDYFERYRLKFLDVVHAFLSVLVFGACAIASKDVRSCLIPPNVRPSELTYIVNNIPHIVGSVASVVFLGFPTRRRWLGIQSLPLA